MARKGRRPPRARVPKPPTTRLTHKNFLRRLSTYFKKGNELYLLRDANVTSIVEINGRSYVYHSDCSRGWKDTISASLREPLAKEYAPNDFPARPMRAEAGEWSDSGDEEDWDHDDESDGPETAGIWRVASPAEDASQNDADPFTSPAVRESQTSGGFADAPPNPPSADAASFVTFPFVSDAWNDHQPPQSTPRRPGLPTVEQLKQIREQAIRSAASAQLSHRNP